MDDKKKDKKGLMDILFKKAGRTKQKGKSIAEKINWSNKNKKKRRVHKKAEDKEQCDFKFKSDLNLESHACSFSSSFISKCHGIRFLDNEIECGTAVVQVSKPV